MVAVQLPLRAGQSKVDCHRVLAAHELLLYDDGLPSPSFEHKSRALGRAQSAYMIGAEGAMSTVKGCLSEKLGEAGRLESGPQLGLARSAPGQPSPELSYYRSVPSATAQHHLQHLREPIGVPLPLAQVQPAVDVSPSIPLALSRSQTFVNNDEIRKD